MRHVKLDNLCATIAECRETGNQAKLDEQGACQSALGYMHAQDINSYSQRGVQLVRVPGEEKLRVRLVPAGSGASVSGGTVDAGTSDYQTEAAGDGEPD